MNSPVSASDRPLQVFISYARKDLAFAERIATGLESRGLEVKIDMRDLPKLEDWRRELLGFIREADAVVFIISTHSISSPICHWEVEQVAHLSKRVAPIVIERVSNTLVPEAISRINYIFFDGPEDFDAQVDVLCHAMQTDLGWIKEHTRFGEIARRWDERNRSNGLMLRGNEPIEAERWLASRPRGAPEPTVLHRNLIQESRASTVYRQRVTVAGSIAAAVVGLCLAGLAYWQRGIAVDPTAIRAASTSTIRLAVRPSPRWGIWPVLPPLHRIFSASATMVAGSVPARRLVPSSTVTGRSVLSRIVMQGTPSAVVSSCRPPLLVSTSVASFQRLRKLM